MAKRTPTKYNIFMGKCLKGNIQSGKGTKTANKTVFSNCAKSWKASK